MKQTMKLCTATAIALLIGSGLYAADVFAQLGITEERAEQAVGGVLSNGLMNPGLPSAAFNAMPPSTRAAVATAGLAWLRSYTATPQFQKMYAALRDSHKPAPPSYKMTPEEELKADAPKPPSDDDLKKMMATLSPEQRKQVEETMKRVAAQLAEMDTPANRKMRLDAIKAQRAQDQQQYEQSIAEWQKKYPADPKPLIVERLRAFMTLSADVDFTAATSASGDRRVFANPQYERKPESWKLCYRAGKEATQAARSGVQEWLKTLGG